MRTVRIFLLGIAVLGGALLLRFWLKWAILAVAAVPLVLLITGQFFLPRPKQHIRLWADPALLAGTDKITLRLSGKSLSLGFFKSWHEFDIETCNLWLLTIVAMASLGAVTGIGMTEELPMPATYLYYVGSVWFLVCELGWRWLQERRAMRKSGFAIGSFHVAGMEGPLLRRINFQFIDHNGDYRGGSFRSLFCDTRDNLTIVFFDEDNPDVSVPASSMMFHRLQWGDPASVQN
jgi:hypothetical protein